MATTQTTLGGLIRARRKSLGISQLQLADTAGISQVDVSRYEGGSVPSLDRLQRIAAVLGIDLGELSEVAA
jgi:transcriptional regulator with XRE-family HTH domain